MWDIISQIAIIILGSSGIFLVAKKNKWGFVLGLLSQPFWFITAIVNQQLGVFLVTIVFTCSWALGVYEWFFADTKKQKR